MCWTGAASSAAQLLHEGVALLALGALDLDLDEFVRLQRALDFGNDGRSEAVVADRDDGVEVMGAGAQVAALGRGELGH